MYRSEQLYTKEVHSGSKQRYCTPVHIGPGIFREVIGGQK